MIRLQRNNDNKKLFPKGVFSMKKTMTIALSAAALTLALAACGSSPKTQAPSYVGMDAAKNAALADAGVSTTDAVFTTAELDDKNGTAYYELKFSDGTAEYEYDVDALTGVVIEGKKDDATGNTAIVNSGSGNAADITGTAIDEEKAKSIALSDAGVKEADTSYLVVKADYDDGTAVYDVEFYVASTKLEYDYEIDAATGEIRSYDYDAEYYTPTQNTSSYIGETKAKQIVEQKAGTTGTYHEFKLDYDDGRAVYEGELRSGRMEYEFEIDAVTGTILDWDADWDD